jgi:thiosulfate/3-mercaptopyruvate sulfurtransferase
MSLFTSPLISVEQLNNLVGSEHLIVLDASIPPVGKMQRSENSWPDVAIANARFFDIENDFSDTASNLPHTLASTSQFQCSCQKLGINKDSLIVVYDNLGMFSSARAWYLLKSMGHKQVAVLNGGLPAWLSAGFSVKPVYAEKVVKGNFSADFDHASFCNADYVEQSTENSNVAILDARAEERFLGLAPEPRAGVRAGHIPNSKSLPYANLLKDGALKSKSELEILFAHVNHDENCQWIMTCGSGITACILALAANIIGHNNLCVYDGSWSEWGQDYSREVSTQSR